MRTTDLIVIFVPPRNNLDSEERDYERNSSRKRQREPSPKEEEEAEHDYPEAFQPSCSQSYGPNHREKKSKRYSEPERAHQTISYGSQEGKSWGRASPVHSSDQEYSDYGHAVSPEPSESPQELYMDHYASEEHEVEETVFHPKASKGHSFQDKSLGNPERNLGESHSKGNLSRSKEHKSSHKEKQRLDAKGEERTLTFSPDKLHKASLKEQFREAPSAGGSKEKQRTSDGTKKEKNREGSSSRKEKSQPHFEEALDNHVKKQKHRDSEKAKIDKAKPNLELSGADREKRKPEGDSSNRSKGKGLSSSLKTAEGKLKASNSDKKSVGFSSSFGEAEMEDEFEQPTMSFESYLSYDQPQKKKKKVVKSSGSVPEKDRGHSKQNGSKASTKSSDSSRKGQSHKQASGKKSEKKQSEASKPPRVRAEGLHVNQVWRCDAFPVGQGTGVSLHLFCGSRLSFCRGPVSWLLSFQCLGLQSLTCGTTFSNAEFQVLLCCKTFCPILSFSPSSLDGDGPALGRQLDR